MPGDFPISKDSVLNAFITEAVVLKISAAPCASAMLLRSVLEKTLIVFIKKTGNYQSVKDYFYSTSEGQKKNHTEEQKKHQGIDLSMMLNWLKQNNVALDIFGIEEKAQLSLAARKASKHTQKLNGVVHGIDFVDDKQVSNIRNEIYPLLEFCVAEVSKILSE
ncbi:hypothetical protein [Pasteurella testudinis]|uniref:hypothetical protein n=1 Tax=Pasteurella testudinis TaxID=761 RepID=UPI004059CE18